MLTNRRSTPTLGLILSIVATVCFLPASLPGVKLQVVSAAAADTTELSLEAKGSGLNPRGKWSETVTYNRDDLVTSRGSTWRSKHDNNLGRVPGQTNPSTATDWQAFSVGFNPLGAWLSSSTYQPNDLVTHIGSTWRAMRTSVNKVPGLAPHIWEQFAAKGAAGGSAVARGSVTLPSFSFTGDSDTGIFSPEPGKIALVEDGHLFLHNKGNSNIALGIDALSSTTAGGGNVAVGIEALKSDTTGSNNTAVGREALQSNTIGSINTAVGIQALKFNIDGIQNTAVGGLALFFNTGGHNNTAIGNAALADNSTGESNTAVGRATLFHNTTGLDNTAVGYNALARNSTGSNNVALGSLAGNNATAPSNSIFVGNEGLAGDTATIKIGTQGTQTTAFMAGVSGVTVANGAAVLINTSTGQLGTISSSRRYKEDIQPMGHISAALRQLRPVTFRYKKPYDDGSKPIQYGLIAEEVAEVLPDLVVFNADGKPETVAYHLLPSFLLAEYQRQQTSVESQQRDVEQLQQTVKLQAEQLERQQKIIEAQAAQTDALRRDVDNVKALLARSVQGAAQHAQR